MCVIAGTCDFYATILVFPYKTLKKDHKKSPRRSFFVLREIVRLSYSGLFRKK
tara:strand:- start:955 stop:1113 length:159 start_codon:yes stop_codon:yes gene_type:complete